jgi:ATP-binding cassette, subfamily C, bacterial CydD
MTAQPMQNGPGTGNPDGRDEPSIAGMRAKQKAQQGWLKQQTAAARLPLMLTVGLGFAAGLCVIGQSWLLATILYRAIVEGAAPETLLPLLIAMGAVLLLRAVLMGLAEQTGLRAALKVKTALRQQLLARIAAAGPEFVTATGSGRLVSAAYDQIEALDNYIARYLPQRLLAGLVPFAIVAVVLPLNWIAGLILLGTAPLIVMLMALVGLGAASASKRQMLALERLSGYFADRLRGLDTLRLFGQADAELQRVRRIADDFRSRTMSVLRLGFLSSAVLEFFSAISIALLAVNIGLALLGLLTFGPLKDITLYAGLFILLLAPEFYLPLRQLGQYYHDRATALAAADSMMELEQLAAAEPHAIAPPETFPKAPATIRFEQVGLTYDLEQAGQGRMALEGIDLELRMGECLALVGASGSGKSSLLKLLLGFTAASEGRISLDGLGLGDELPLNALRQHAAWIGQRTHLFRDTIAGNIALGRPDATRAEIEAAAERAGVMAFAARHRLGLDTMLDATGGGVSGGEAQRIALARAFLADRPILLMDEPTAHLDRATTASVIAGLRELIPGRLVIAATHTPAVLALADRVICLDKGRLVLEQEAARLLDEVVL